MDNHKIAINKERLIKDFLELVTIKSPSEQEEKISKRLKVIFKNLGLKSVTDRYGNLIFRLPGEGKPIALCAHMDTTTVGEGAKIKAIVNDKIIKTDGKTILGADNKDSIAAIIEALKIIKETKKFKNRAAEIIITKEEELISKGAKNLNYGLIESKECIISDSSEPYGTVIVSAPYCFQFEIKILGERSHTKEPSKGIDVNKIIGKALQSAPLGAINNRTTSNIAFQAIGLKGQIDNPESKLFDLMKSNRNIVPDFGVVAGEVRGIDPELVQKCLNKIKTAFTKASLEFGGKSTFKMVKFAEGYSFSEKDPLILEIKKIFKSQKIKTKFSSFAEGSDANIFNKRRIKTVVISSAHRNNHRTTEYSIIKDLMNLTDFYIRLLEVQ